MSKLKAYLPALTFAALLGGAAVVALAPPAAVPAAAAVAPGWTVDPAASSLGFDGVMTDSGSDFSGVFKKWTADINFDPANLAASNVTVTIDPTSMVSDYDDATESFPWPEWMNAAQFPTATFKANSFKDLGGGKYEAVGTLKLRDVEKPITLPFNLAINGDTAKMDAKLDVDRTDWGVGQGKYKGDDFVAKKVTIKVAVTAKRKA